MGGGATSVHDNLCESVQLGFWKYNKLQLRKKCAHDILCAARNAQLYSIFTCMFLHHNLIIQRGKKTLLIPRRTKGLWHSFDGETVLRYVHDWDTGDFPYSSPQIFIAGGDNVATVLFYTFTYAVICVCPSVCANQASKTLVFRYAQS